jgi:hypothetical protein
MPHKVGAGRDLFLKEAHPSGRSFSPRGTEIAADDLNPTGNGVCPRNARNYAKTEGWDERDIPSIKGCITLNFSSMDCGGKLALDSTREIIVLSPDFFRVISRISRATSALFRLITQLWLRKLELVVSTRTLFPFARLAKKNQKEC